MPRYVVFLTSNDGYEAAICESRDAVPAKVREMLCEPDSNGDSLSPEEMARMERDLKDWDHMDWLCVSGRAAWKVTAYVAELTE